MGNKNPNWLSKKKIATGILCCAAVAALYGGFFYENNDDVAIKPPDTTVSEQTEISEPVTVNKNAQSEYDNLSDTSNDVAMDYDPEEEVSQETNDTAQESETQTTEVAQNTDTEQSFDEPASTASTENNNDSGFIWPVNGEIVMDYSVETAIFDTTLEQYRTNDFVSISANTGDNVLAAASGTVEFVGVDATRGNMVVINHNDGWKTTYCQLQEGILVEEGQTVSKGEKIGLVADPTIYSVELGSHLDFKVTNADESVDPEVALNQ